MDTMQWPNLADFHSHEVFHQPNPGDPIHVKLPQYGWFLQDNKKTACVITQVERNIKGHVIVGAHNFQTQSDIIGTEIEFEFLGTDQPGLSKH